MSTFLGIVEEIPGISVDRFDGENLQSSAFFLSHHHTDHMRGLNKSFINYLKDTKKFMYCSLLTKIFLEDTFGLDESQSENIKVVVPCSPIIVEYIVKGQLESINLVSINAGHCPGSVMFIFDRQNVSVLYTGDFRINPRDLPKLKPLHDQAGGIMLPKKFDKIYLDTTFWSLDYKDFPTRQESLSEIIRVADNWIAQNPLNVVNLECPALYGSEFIFMEMSDYFNKRVHVKSCVYQNFSRIPELERSITNDGSSTPIHACTFKGQKDGLQCRDVSAENILTIVLSALRWKGKDLSMKISEWDQEKKKRFYVCLSMHSSYNELKAFIEYFDAKKIFPCVEPRNYVGCIQDELNEITKKTVKTAYSPSKTYKLESLKRESLKRLRFKSAYFSDDSD